METLKDNRRFKVDLTLTYPPAFGNRDGMTLVDTFHAANPLETASEIDAAFEKAMETMVRRDMPQRVGHGGWSSPRREARKEVLDDLWFERIGGGDFAKTYDFRGIGSLERALNGVPAFLRVDVTDSGAYDWEGRGSEPGTDGSGDGFPEGWGSVTISQVLGDETAKDCGNN